MGYPSSAFCHAHSPLNAKNHAGQTALEVCIGYQDENVVRMLLTAGSQVTIETVRLLDAWDLPNVEHTTSPSDPYATV